MTSQTSPAIGLSIGTSTLVAVTAERVLTGRPVVNRAGVAIDDFVHRVGDPVGIVGADGSMYSAAALLAEALHDLARAAVSGRPLPADVGIAYPAYWPTLTVGALDRALRRVDAWSSVGGQHRRDRGIGGLMLLPDSTAALTALRDDPGLPTSGVVAVCDFGAGGTTVTLVDAGDGWQMIGEPLRYPDCSGDSIDRALLTHVLAAAGQPPEGTGTSAIGALTRLRAECRAAKERLSTETVATVAGEPAGVRADIRITRPELDGLLRPAVAAVAVALQDSMQRNGIAVSDLVAVAAVGGMAALPVVVTTLSQQLRVPIITARQPGLSAAAGAALRVAGGVADAGETVRTATRQEPADEPPARAWSQAPEIPEYVPQVSAVPPMAAEPRPRLDFVPEDAPAGEARVPWHRRPLLVAAAVLAVVAGAGGATALALRMDAGTTPAQTTPGSSTTTVPPAASASDAGAPSSPRTVVAVPGPSDGGSPPALQPVSPAEPGPASQAPVNEPAPVSQAAPVDDPQPAPAAPPAEQAAPSSAAPVVEEAAPPASTPPPFTVIPAIPTIPPIPSIPAIPIPQIPGLPSLLSPPPSG